jgi:hypothetical protein
MLAAATLAGCVDAKAAPDVPSGMAPPAGWQALPEVAKAARDGLGSTVTVHGAEAWGEPARGCYGVWLAVTSGGAATQVVEDVLAGFAHPAGSGSAAPAPFVVSDVVKPTAGEGLARLAVTHGGHRGKVSARLGGGRITLVACFANQREPASCEPGCNALLGAIR